MASCARCGKQKIRKRKDGRRKCVRCGYLPNGCGMLRNGMVPPKVEPARGAPR